jgi:histidinol-phosphate aminotransferase
VTSRDDTTAQPAPAHRTPPSPDGPREPGPHQHTPAPHHDTDTGNDLRHHDADTDHDLSHHGDTEVRGTGLVDLAVNVRADTPPPWLRARIAASLEGLAAYPDGTAARAAVAARHGVPVERVLLTAGAAEAFVLLARVLAGPGRRALAVVVHPQFTEPERALRDAGHAVRRLGLRVEHGFRLTARAVSEVPGAADLVVVGNPVNPTSVLHPAARVTSLAGPGRLLVVDEAFMDAVPGEHESLAGRTDVPGLVVVRSLTKMWGLAGLRIGYVLAAPEVIAALQGAQPPWPVSTPALTATEACLAPHALAEASRAATALALDRDHLVRGLDRVGAAARGAARGLRVVGPARGPFVLVRMAGADEVRERLRERGFAVRRGDTFPGLGTEWLRIAVRDRATIDRFLHALGEVLG